MNVSRPRVSIGLPVFNGARYLTQAIDAFLAQTMTDFELVISDNGSTDRTPEICRTYAAEDTRIRWVRSEENRGAAWNYNHVFDQSTGELFKWAAHDDVIVPDFLTRCVEALDRNPTAVLSYTDVMVIDAQGRELGQHAFDLKAASPDPEDRFASLLSAPHRCFPIFGLIRTQVLRQTPRIGAYVSSDRILLAWLVLRGPFCHVPKPLFLSRSHAQQSVQALSDPAVYAAWYDPAAEGGNLRRWRLLAEHINAVRKAPLTWVQRQRCYLHLAHRFGRAWRAMAQEIARAG